MTSAAATLGQRLLDEIKEESLEEVCLAFLREKLYDHNKV